MRTSRKLCVPCWQAEKKTAQSLVASLPSVADKDAPLGYNFVINDYFLDTNKGKKYAIYCFNSLCHSFA